MTQFRTSRRLAVLGAAILAAAILGGCSSSPVAPPTPVASTPGGILSAPPAASDHVGGEDQAEPDRETSGERIESARAAVDRIEVKGRAPRTGYDRSLFGDGWLDLDGDGCGTRDEVLAAQLTDLTFAPGGDGCIVTSGVLADPYSGRDIRFHRGAETSMEVQIDHVVALSNAWQTGAQAWDAQRRAQFANDPLNLRAVDGPLNQEKGDGDAATWLPPAKGIRCEYVATQVAVKLKWGLWMTAPERDAIVKLLDACPEQMLPEGSDAPAGVPVAPPAAATVEQAFASCAEARAAGKAPVRRGEPGYSARLDRDGDGVGCEG